MNKQWISFLTLVSLISFRLFGQNCADFVVLDHYSSSTDYTVYEKLKDTVCKETISDKGSATSAGIAAGIPIPVLDDVFSLDLKGSTASNDWSHWKENFCHSSYYEEYEHLQNKNL